MIQGFFFQGIAKFRKADIESKIAKKEKEIFDYQTKIEKEQSNLGKKRNAEAEKSLKIRIEA